MLVKVLIAALATWRLSSLVMYETGPFHVFVRLRSVVSRGPAVVQELFSCMYCFSMWIGLLCGWLILTEVWFVLLPFALSAVAIGVDKCFTRLSK